MKTIILGVAIGVALGLGIYNNFDTIVAFLTGVIGVLFKGIYKVFVWIIDIITRPIRYLFGWTKPQLEKKIQEKETEKEKEYQAALAKGDKYAKISKDAYFLHKIEKERKAEKKKIQAKIDKYGSNISDEEAERLDRIKKQKAEYDALSQEEKDKLKKKRRKDWIIIIVSFLSPYILGGLILLVATIVEKFR